MNLPVMKTSVAWWERARANHELKLGSSDQKGPVGHNKEINLESM